MKKLKGTTTPFDFKSFIKTGQSVLDLQLKKAREEAPEVAQHTIDLVTKQTSIKQMNSVREDAWEDKIKVALTEWMFRLSKLGQLKDFENRDKIGGFWVFECQEIIDIIRTLLEEREQETIKRCLEEIKYKFIGIWPIEKLTRGTINNYYTAEQVVESMFSLLNQDISAISNKKDND